MSDYTCSWKTCDNHIVPNFGDQFGTNGTTEYISEYCITTRYLKCENRANQRFPTYVMDGYTFYNYSPSFGHSQTRCRYI